jgi:CubicO group peptidase (beta-lactamase class C family)
VFTKQAILQMIKVGKLELDTKVFPDVFGPLYNYQVCPGSELITIEHLLNHTVGVWPTTTRTDDPMFNKKELPHKQLIQAVLKETKINVD